jgi:hypothetical protein
MKNIVRIFLLPIFTLFFACPFWGGPVEPQIEYPLASQRVIHGTAQYARISSKTSLYANGQFFIGGDGAAGEYTHLYKYSVDGSLQWKHNLAELFPEAPGIGILATITQIEDRLYLVGYTGLMMGNSAVLYCLQLDSAGQAQPLYWKALYTANLTGGESVNTYNQFLRPFLWQDRIVLPISYFSDGVDTDYHTNIYIITPEAEDAASIWHRRFSWATSQVGTYPVHGDKLYLGNHGRMRILNLDELIDPNITNEACSIVTVQEDNIQLGGIDLNVVFYQNTWITHAMTIDLPERGRWIVARDIDTNEIVWRVDLKDERYPQLDLRPCGNISIHGNSLFVPGNFGYLACVDLETKSLRWVTRAAEDYIGSNLYARGVVLYDKWYVQPSYSDGCIFVFDVATGETLLCFKLSQYSVGAVENCWVHNDLFYITAKDGLSAIRIYEK